MLVQNLLRNVTYEIDADSKYERLLLTRCEIAHQKELPDEVSTQLDYISVTLDVEKLVSVTPYDSKSNIKLVQMRGIELARQIFNKYCEFWDFNYGYPYFKFTGDINPLPDEIKDRSLVLGVLAKQTDRDITVRLQQWAQQIGFLTKIYFVASPSYYLGSLFQSYIATTSHKEVHNWVKRVKYDLRQTREHKEKYNLDLRMKNWYGDNYEALLKAAKTTIDEFVVVKKFAKKISAFLIVPAFHITRYKTSVKLFEEIYTYDFIMTLPLLHEGRSYTILFPV